MFKLDPDEVARYKAWETEHIKNNHGGDHPDGMTAIGGAITFTFTPTGLGVIKHVKCACGESICLTNFENW